MDQNIKHNIELLKQIDESRNNIKKKMRFLDRTKNENDEFIKNSLKPLVEPLEKITSDMQTTKELIMEEKQNSKQNRNKKQIVKKKIETEQIENEENLSAIKNLFDNGFEMEEAKDQVGSNFLSYFQKILDKPQRWDKVYGLRVSSTGWHLGDSTVIVNKDTFTMNDISTKATDGLLELLFLKNPDLRLVTEEDLENYKKMVLASNAHRRGYSKHNDINWNRGSKYVKVISRLFAIKGDGLRSDLPHILYFKNYNELVDRLQVLYASQLAGNDNVHNEIMVITNRLKRDNIIY